MGLKNKILNFVPTKKVIKMSEVVRIYRRFVPQLFHMIVLPVFYFVFMLIYSPFGLVDFIGQDWYGVHVTIISSIVLVCIIASRLLYYFLPLKLTYTLYAVWCVAETIFISFFAALYLWLVLHKPMSYFDMLSISLQSVFLTLIFPYSILALSMRVVEYSRSTADMSDDSSHRMRFYDEKHNLKIVLQSDTVLYIQADINYVTIYYLDNGKVKSYMLRNSMKAIDELCQDNGLVRCQRSFYVNPVHIRVLRKEKDGVVFAELDADDVRHIPVTKRYYDRLAEMLY